MKVDIDAGDGPAAVQADRSQLLQVLLNLALNARDAMTPGGTLTIRVRHMEGTDQDARARVCIEVEDTGNGMSREVQARAFEPFFTTKPAGSGTGLGLSVVYGIVKQHGGSVEVDSVLDQGTTFRVMLPAAEGAPARPVPRRATEPGARGGGERILVAEDEPMVRDAATRLLTSAGYHVVAAMDGHDALAAYDGDAGDVALLLTDVVMPRLDGIGLAERLRQRRPDLPVLFTTGYARPGGAALEGERVLVKPYDADELLRAVRDALDAVSHRPQAE